MTSPHIRTVVRSDTGAALGTVSEGFAIQDRSFTMRFFDVHYWPGTGRIVMVHGDPAYGSGSPVVTEMHVSGEPHSADLSDTTTVVAVAMVNAANPAGELFEHQVGRTVNQLDVFSLATIRPDRTA